MLRDLNEKIFEQRLELEQKIRDMQSVMEGKSSMPQAGAWLEQMNYVRKIAKEL